MLACAVSALAALTRGLPDLRPLSSSQQVAKRKTLEMAQRNLMLPRERGMLDPFVDDVV